MKEQTEKIFRAIGDVGDDLIERADRPVRKHAQVWVKWAALAACCALVIGAAAFIVPMFHAGSSAPETASLSVDTSPAETELAAQEMETAEAAPEEAMEEPAAAEAPEASEKSTQALPGADCFAVVPESVTRMSADFQLTCEEDVPLALRSECWLEMQKAAEEAAAEQARQAAHRKLLLRIGGVGIFSILVIALAVVLIRKLHKAGKC